MTTVPGLSRVDCQLSDGVLWSELASSLAGTALIRSVQALAIRHFHLASTTVTAIPMKALPSPSPSSPSQSSRV